VKRAEDVASARQELKRLEKSVTDAEVAYQTSATALVRAQMWEMGLGAFVRGGLGAAGVTKETFGLEAIRQRPEGVHALHLRVAVQRIRNLDEYNPRRPQHENYLSIGGEAVFGVNMVAFVLDGGIGLSPHRGAIRAPFVSASVGLRAIGNRDLGRSSWTLPVQGTFFMETLFFAGRELGVPAQVIFGIEFGFDIGFSRMGNEADLRWDPSAG
jgi:hypothetical protein